MTIAQRLKITEFPFTIKDSRGNQIYFERSDGFWVRTEFDSNNNDIYGEISTGYWSKREYDSKGTKIYIEDSDGYIYDNRPKKVTELTNDYIPEKKFTKQLMLSFAEHCMMSLLTKNTSSYGEITVSDMQRIKKIINKFNIKD